MKSALSISILSFFFLQCASGTAPVNHSVVSDQSVGEQNRQTSPPDTLSIEAPVQGWQEEQDSIRQLLLDRKDNEILKNSFLQELYIRGIATPKNTQVKVVIPFNLHSPDCGAPDCYTTEVSFILPLKEKVIFPDKIDVTEEETGCVDQETKWKSSFELVEKTPDVIIYYSAEHKRTLVLFDWKVANSNHAYYFTEVERKTISAKNVFDVLALYDDEDENALWPYMSHSLTTNEYELFLHD